jgi:predicted TIM-barrel enzyme
MTPDIRQYLEERILILDGAMGSMIQQYKLSEDDVRGKLFLGHHKDLKNFSDVLCLTHADKITAIHEQYLEAGADIIVAHMGLTTSGTIGAKTALTLADCAPKVGEILDAARSVRPDVIVLCHGGPIAMPEDAQFMMNAVPAINGFYGASSMERLPTEIALTEQVRKFTAIRRDG